MPKEIGDNTKTKTTRTRRSRAVVAETEAVPKPRRRVSRATVVAAAPERKAPTVYSDETNTNQTAKIKVSRHWYVVTAMLAITFGGAAYIGFQDKGAIDVDTLMTERKRALQEDRAARSIPVQNQAAVASALEEESVEVNEEVTEESLESLETPDNQPDTTDSITETEVSTDI